MSTQIIPQKAHVPYDRKVPTAVLVETASKPVRAPRSGRTAKHGRDEQREATRATILAAAIASFGRDGYAATSIEDIAREAGVSKGLVHYHFASRDQLALEVQSAIFSRISVRIEHAAAQFGPSVEQALWALDELWNTLKEVRPLFAVTLDLAARSLGDPELRRRVTDFEVRQRELLKSGIVAVAGPLVEQTGLTVERLSDAISVCLIGLLSTGLYMPDAPTADVVYGDLKRIFLTFLTHASVPTASPKPAATRPT